MRGPTVYAGVKEPILKGFSNVSKAPVVPQSCTLERDAEQLAHRVRWDFTVTPLTEKRCSCASLLVHVTRCSWVLRDSHLCSAALTAL